ncbi:MAG: hypothetical protein M9894_39445 [Planctomycetes bacterium]|nr:hypothetical protein [Planctomycetota bacterium]
MAGGLKGPGDLLAELEAYDVVRYPNIRPPLSNLALGRRGLYELITAAYKVSMRRDEGRYPRFVAFVPPAAERLDEANVCVRFQRPVPVDPDALHRLGPGIPGRPYALLIRGSDAGPVAEGIVRTERTGLELLPTLRYAAGTVMSGGLYLSVDGPGDLTAVDFSGSLHKILNLRAGEIRAAFDATAAGISRVVFGNLERSVREQADPVAGLSTNRLVRGADLLPRLVRGAWGYILQRAIELAHGGTFVVLPPGAGLGEVENNLRVPVRTGGLRDIADFLVQLLFPAGSDEDHIKRLQDVAHAIEDQSRSIAQLSSVDGCVVVSHRLGLLGFAGEIRVADERDVPDCAELDPMAQGLRPTGPFDLRQHGTRHRSAARLCQQVPGVFAYVVSQDGNIRAFTRLVDGRVGVCGPLRLLVGSSAFV